MRVCVEKVVLEDFNEKCLALLMAKILLKRAEPKQCYRTERETNGKDFRESVLLMG